MSTSTELANEAGPSPYPMGWAATLRGRRTLNEDAFLIEREFGVYAVADGVGGEEGGEVASHLVIEALTTFLREEKAQLESEEGELTLRLAIASARESLIAESRGPLHRMGTTLAVLQIRPQHVVIAHVGDSRIYRLRDGELTLLTRDHNVGERYPTHVGEKHPARALTQALTSGTRGIPDVSIFDRQAGDLYFLCTDGVSEPLTHDALTNLLKKTAPSLCAAQTVAGAIDAGGGDNATAVVVYDDEARCSSLRRIGTPADGSAYETHRG